MFTSDIGVLSTPLRAPLCRKLARLGVKLGEQADISNGPRIFTSEGAAAV
jgi:hypothetical protein